MCTCTYNFILHFEYLKKKKKRAFYRKNRSNRDKIKMFTITGTPPEIVINTKQPKKRFRSANQCTGRSGRDYSVVRIRSGSITDSIRFDPLRLVDMSRKATQNGPVCARSKTNNGAAAL